MSNSIKDTKIKTFTLNNNGLDFTLEDNTKGRTNFTSVNNKSNYINHLINLRKVYGGDLYRRSDGTYYLSNKNGDFYQGGRAYNVKTETVEDYDMHTGRFYSSLAAEQKAKSNKPTPTSTNKPTPTSTNKPTPTSTNKPTPTSTNKPTPHSATYTPLEGATGAYAVKGWTTNDWGGGEKGVLDASVALKLGLKEGATAEDAQNFLISKGYGITSDNYWGKQSLAAFNDYINRGAVKTTTAETPQLDTLTERHNYSTYNPQTKLYSYDSSFEITPQQLKEAGVTNFRGYLNFMGNANNANNLYKNVYNFFNRVKEQNQGVNFGDETSFNKFFGTKNHFGRRDRNRIILAGARSQYNYDRVSPDGTPLTARSDYGKLYDTLYNKLTADDRAAGNISWFTSGNNRIPVYQDSSGTYYKVGDDGNLTQTGTYTMGNDGKYSISFKHGGSLNKFLQGGSINMNEQQLQQAFLLYLAQQTGAKSQQELEQVIQQMGEDGLKQAYAQFVQAMQLQQVQAAKFGAKLNYIKQLNGQCPQGMEMYYYKEGGRLCKKCMQAKQNGGELENQAPANPIDAFKCGRKIRKNLQGKKFPLIETDKNGKNKKVYYKDEATRDSIAANRYNDQEVLINRPGSYKKNAKGKVQWTPDRTKAPYKRG